MHKWSAALVVVLMGIVICGCRTEGTGESPMSPLQTEDAATIVSPLKPTATVSAPLPPEPGKATVIGSVVSRSEGAPLMDVVVRLAAVYRQGDDGAFVLEDGRSPGTVTDLRGHFAIENVEPGEYVMVVGDVTTNYEIIAESSGVARVWDIPSDQILDAGELEVDLSP